MMTCRECGQNLPNEAFERYPTGTYRRVCRQCKYQLYGIKAKRRWRLRQLATAMHPSLSTTPDPSFPRRGIG